MYGSILSILGSVIGMITSKGASDEFSTSLENIAAEQVVPPSAVTAKRKFAEFTAGDMPGFAGMIERVKSRGAETLRETRDWLTSGNIVDFLAKSQARTSEQLQTIEDKNVEGRLRREEMEAMFLGGPMARMERGVQMDKSQIGIYSAFGKMKQASTEQDYLTSILGGAGDIADADWQKILALLSRGSGEQTDERWGDYAF